MGQQHNPQSKSDGAKGFQVTPEVEQEIIRALQNLAFGSVEIVVHDSKVVQIERKEKVRFS